MKHAHVHGPRPSVLIAGALAVGLGGLLVAPAAWAQWGSGGGTLYTESGIEISVDARIVSVFAMLNGLGFDKETVFGEPPLERPGYTKAREDARSSLGRPGPGLKKFEGVVASYPKPAYIYARAAVELGGAPDFEPAGKVPKMTAKLYDPLRTWFNEEGGVGIFRQVAQTAKPDLRALLDALNPTTAKLASSVRLGDDEEQLLDDTGPSGRVVLSYNPLDAHGELHRFDNVKGVTWIITGPYANKEQQKAARDATLLAYTRTLVAREAAKASGAGSLPATVFASLDKDGKGAFDDAKNLGTELLACAILKAVHKDAACQGSALAEHPKAMEALAAVEPRASQWLKGTTLLQEGAAIMLAGAEAPAPAPAPQAPPPAAPAAKDGAAAPKPAPAKPAPATP